MLVRIKTNRVMPICRRLRDGSDVSRAGTDRSISTRSQAALPPPCNAAFGRCDEIALLRARKIEIWKIQLDGYTASL